MQGVQQQQGTWTTKKGGRSRVAEYEAWAAIGRCPECKEDLVKMGGELVCEACGLVAGRADTGAEDNHPTQGCKSEPLGSIMVTDSKNAKLSPTGPAFGWARLQPNLVGRGGPLIPCSILTNRMVEKLNLPKSVAEQANAVAERILPYKKACKATVPAISAYSLLHACRTANIARISHREIVAAYRDAGYRVSTPDLLQIGLESPIPLPQPSIEELVRAVVARLQSSERVAKRLTKANIDPKVYFTRLFELGKETASKQGDLMGFSPRTRAAGSVYVASLTMEVRTFTQREAAEALSMAEFTVREFCCRTKDERVAEQPVRLAVKSAPAPGGHDS